MNNHVMELLALAQEKRYEVCIWGAGNVGTHFGLQMLRKRGIAVNYYCDGNPGLWGKEVIDGIRCISAEEMKDRNPICFIMVSVALIDQVLAQAKALGIEKIVTYDDLCVLELETYFPFWSRKQISVYTCIVGGYDELKEPVSLSPDCDYYVISDKKPGEGSAFRFMNSGEWIPASIEDNTRKNRYCKLNPHILFPQYRYSIYFDGNIRLKANITEKIAALPKTRIVAAANNPIKNVYMEAMRAAEHFRDKKELFLEQTEKYWLEGMPDNFGSVTCSVLIREHNHPVCQKIMKEWWEQVDRYTKKDQVSFPYILWKNGYTIADVQTVNGDDTFNDTYMIYERVHTKPRV